MSERDSLENVRSVPEAPRAGKLTLTFTPDLESEYRAARSDTDRRWARMSLYVALSTVLGFAVIDHFVLFAPRMGHADLVRFGLQLPMVLVMLVITNTRFFVKWYQPAIQVAAPLFGIGSVILAAQASPEQLPLVAARLLLAVFFFYFMITLSFYAAIRTNAVLIVAYCVATALGYIPAQIATYQLFVLLCANLIGALGCYALEHANRVSFLDRRRLVEVAMHDGLTGLLNRAALEEQTRKLWQQAIRDRQPVSVVLIDIDHFKAYNDCYGHQAGDQCLRDVAIAVRRAARRRPLDLVARYGGEEFIAVLFGADRSHAESVARGVLDAIRGLHIPHTGSLTRPHVTASVGIASVDPFSGYAHDLAVQLADKALYSAKETGRDSWASCFDQAAAVQLASGAPDSRLKAVS
ncbi:MAG: diguanylate cyclase [Gammaproteobacteria bacterium]